jgi:hypothetical protein
MLADQMRLSSIEVVREYSTGVGDLDFMFLGIVSRTGQRRLCAEFKNAHSDDLERGLTVQLPQYMKNQRATYGAFCVLWYKGEGFDHPHDLELLGIRDGDVVDCGLPDVQYRTRGQEPDDGGV